MEGHKRACCPVILKGIVAHWSDTNASHGSMWDDCLNLGFQGASRRRMAIALWGLGEAFGLDLHVWRKDGAALWQQGGASIMR